MNARPLWMPRSELTPEEAAALKAGMILTWGGPEAAHLIVLLPDEPQHLPTLPETIARLDPAITNVRRHH